MAEGNNAVEGGLRYENGGQKIAASEKTVEGALHTLDVVSERVVGWAERNPGQFYAVLAVVVIWIAVKAWERVKISAQKREYAQRRLEPRGQMPLPLPKPEKRDGEG